MGVATVAVLFTDLADSTETAERQALAGDPEGARRALTGALDGRLLDRDPSGLAGIGTAAWAAAGAADVPIAGAVEARLVPYRGLIAAGSMVEVGAVDRLLAMLAALDGRHDAADELFRSRRARGAFRWRGDGRAHALLVGRLTSRPRHARR
jgi:hypothetical protein